VGRIALELGPLVVLEGVLDRERVEAELVGDLLEVVPVGHAQVGPDDAVLLLEVVGDLLDREVLVGEDALAPDPGARHAPSVNPRRAHSGTHAKGPARLREWRAGSARGAGAARVRGRRRRTDQASGSSL